MEVDFEFLKQFGGYGVLVVIFWRLLERFAINLVAIRTSQETQNKDIEEIKDRLDKSDDKLNRIEGFVATGSNRRRKVHDTDEIR